MRKISVARIGGYLVCAAGAVLCLSLGHAHGEKNHADTTIRWDRGTLRLIQRGADYGRVTRLGDGRVGCVYDVRGRIWIRHSSDEGMHWDEHVLVAEEPDCWLTNADLLTLRDGTLLYFWNERPRAAVAHQHEKAPPGLLTRPFLIRMSRSTDHGRTWSAPRTIYTAGPSYQDGCWEPAGIQLPSGEVQVYFANEFPYPDTAEQEISLLRSHDGGTTWGKAERIAMRANHRDGMPAPLLLQGGRGIVVGIEDNGLAGERFKPVIVYTSLEDNWRSGAVRGDSLHRWSALTEPLEPAWYGGAPCLRQLPSGETLLSYQESEDGGLKRCRMAVCVGDRDARNFTNKTYPLPLGPEGNQAWNSLFIKNARTVVAIMTATVNGTRGVWAIDGRIERAAFPTSTTHPTN
jgi:hypothetical protein